MTDNQTQTQTRIIPIYQAIAETLQWLENIEGNASKREWAIKAENKLAALEQMLPSGSGIDSGSNLDRVRSTPNKLVIEASYHHMNENGFYDGWTDHIITVKPSLVGGFVLTISGRNRNDIKDHLYEVFNTALRETVDFWAI